VGERLRLTIAEQQPTTTLTVQGALELMAALEAWVRPREMRRVQELAQRHEDGCAAL